MASGIVQASAESVQAGTSIVDTTLRLAGIMVRAMQAKTTLKHSSLLMEKKMIDLRITRHFVEEKFQIYWFPQKQFDLWLSSVDKINLQVRNHTTRFSILEKTSFLKFYPRLQLIEEIDSECTKIDQVIKEGKALEEAMMKRETKRIVKLDTPINIANISALNEKLEHILKCLKNKNINTIGVYGDAWTGKTELILCLNNHEAVAHNMFNIVIWLRVSDFENGGKVSVNAMQLEIAKRLGLGIRGNEDENYMKSKIHDHLDGEKYLLLLDDVRENIRLESIGIPSNMEGSKIVYITNFPYLRPFGKFFPVRIEDKLSFSDSFQMFEDILIDSNDTIQQPEILNIAIKVVTWCDGVFSLIKSVAQYFISRRSQISWSNGLKSLMLPAQKSQLYMQAVENLLHSSYNDLEENEKICILFCVLYPEDNKIPVDCLFDCWRAHNLLQYGVLESSLVGEEILDSLKKKALLKECSNEKYVSMNNVFRVALINILQEHRDFKCLVAQEALERLQSYQCEDAHWISLANSGIDGLPTQAHCPKLTTLFLQNNSKLKIISSSFFEHMNELIILDLYKTGFESLLPMRNLPNLKVLYVNGCGMLKKLPLEIEGIDNMLEILDMRGCIINEIPHGIKMLRHLRRLIVSINGGSSPSRLVICELYSLRELIIDVPDVHMNTASGMPCCNKVIGDIIEKIDTLKELTTLQFRFKDDIVDVIQVIGATLKIFVPKQGSLEHILKERINSHSNALQVYIGSRMTSIREIPTSFIKYYDSFLLCCDQIVSDPLIQEVLVKVKALVMMKNNSMKRLDQIGISSSSMHHIHGCLIHKCYMFETLVQIAGFSNLKFLVLNECSQLKELFSNNVVQQYIEHLEIRDCSAIEEINMLTTSTGGDILPNLTTLVLDNLPMLKKICSDMKLPKLSTLQILKCPNLTELPMNVNSANKLRVIKVEKIWWENLQLGEEIKQRLEQLPNFSH